MKKYTLCLLAIILLTSCFVYDDTCEICTENCTEFKGQIKTVDGQGIEGINLTLEYNASAIFLAAKRIIANTTTDKDGFYSIVAYLEDHEIAEESIGKFEMFFDIHKVNNSISDTYLKPTTIFTNNSRPTAYYYNIRKRDTIYTNRFIVPKKGKLSIKLKNFSPIIAEDYFTVNVYSSYTFFCKGWTSYRPYGGVEKKAVANQTETILNTETILDGDVTVRITKRKNGVIESTDQIIILNSNTVLNLEFDY